MNIRKMVLGAVLVFIGLPVVFVLVAVVSFYSFFYSMPRANGTLVSSGQKREYLLYVPKSYDRTKPTPLVISLHTAATWPATQMEISQWNKVADEHGFIVVYHRERCFWGAAAVVCCPITGTWTEGPVS